MQIHELPVGSPASGLQFAGDTGSQTQKIDYDALADAILNKLTTKTFNIKSESQTIIAALNALGDASKQDVANDLVTTAAGLVLDARQGKALKDLHDTNANAITTLNNNMSINNANKLFLASNVKTVTPTTLQAYANYGGCYYYKIGTRVVLHLGLSGLTANTFYSDIGITMPSGYRPRYETAGYGHGGTTQTKSSVIVRYNGTIGVISEFNYVLVEIIYDAFA